MNVDNNIRSNDQSAMCLLCNKFYASQTFKGLCSSCFKKNSNSSTTQKVSVTQSNNTEIKVQTIEKESQPDQVQEQVKQIDRKRCFTCRKKLGLLGIQCKCGFIFCNGHRLPQEHQCSFNHLQKGMEKLKKEIVKVYNGKITEI